MQTLPPPGSQRASRAATAARMRRRHLSLVVLSIIILGLTVAGGWKAAIYWVPWGNFKWLLGSPQFLDRQRTILVVGLDRSGKGARGDLFMLWRVDAHSPRVLAVSLPPQTQTTIPGFGVGKLQDVPAVGGPALIRTAIESLTGSSVDRFISLEPAGATALIDKLGGVEMPLVSAAASGGALVSRKHLAGREAILYARGAAGRGLDLKRLARQQYLASELVIGASRSPWKFPAFMKALIAVGKGDMTRSDADELGRFLQSKPPVRFATIPGNPGYGGAWIPNTAKLSVLLTGPSRKDRLGSRPPLAEIKFSPLREKDASTLAAALTDRGVTVVRTSALEEEDVTHVISRDPAGKVDDVVRGLMPAVPWLLSDDPSPYSADYTLVLGQGSP